MSMPNIPDITPIIDFDRDEAITLLLASIAMEEMGLAHILNAEGEKLQYVLGLKAKQNICLHDIMNVNESIERVIKSVTRLQLILQDKLDSVVRLIPKEGPPRPGPCPPPKPPKPKPCCTLTGCGMGCVKNQHDDFFGATATLEVLKECERGHYPLRYILAKRGKGCTISAVLIPFAHGLKVDCSILNPCPTPSEPSVFTMQGKGMMCINGFADGSHKATVNFKLQVWDYGIRRQFQVVTWLDNNELYSHDSGIVEVSQGDLMIKPLNKCDEGCSRNDETM